MENNTEVFFTKLNIDLPYDPTIPQLRIYPKECDSGYYKGTCTPMFTTTLFTITKLWKQPRYPTTNKLIKEVWFLYTMQFYLAMKRNEILSFASKWVKLENIILKKVRLRRPKTMLVLPHMGIIELKQMPTYYWAWVTH
jgi:hypothetical protein